jgi:hypothetical protein
MSSILAKHGIVGLFSGADALGGVVFINLSRVRTARLVSAP